jgi:hypothetical protein
MYCGSPSTRGGTLLMRKSMAFLALSFDDWLLVASDGLVRGNNSAIAEDHFGLIEGAVAHANPQGRIS